MKKQNILAITRRILAAAMVITAAVVMSLSIPAASAQREAAPQRASQDVFWIWDSSLVTGTSTLLRNETGVSAVLRTSELAPGHAMTLWFIVFNNPDACATSPCSASDLFNPVVQGDFLLAAGNVVGGTGRAVYGGALQVGDTRGSGMIEIGFPELAVGLLNPLTAEIHLAVHSHGPALRGRELAAQISSYTGGCQTFLGNEFGIAQGFGDVPMLPHQCSTIQASVYQP
jgi:hypothetical protein